MSEEAHHPVPPRLPEVSAEHFFAVDMRIGTVIGCEPFPEAHRPAYRLRIDLGPLGVVESSARIVDHYRPEELVGTQVVCAANLPPRQIGPVRSHVLVIGVYEHGTDKVILLRADRPVGNGDRVG
jgi:tRNA-binding protein